MVFIASSVINRLQNEFTNAKKLDNSAKRQVLSSKRGHVKDDRMELFANGTLRIFFF